MKSRYAKVAAAAAVVIIAVLIGLPFGNTVTFADVVEPILNAKTIVFDMVLGTDDTGMVMHEIVVGSRIRRNMSNMPNITMIIDMDNARLLALDTDAKTAVYADMAGELGDRTRSYIKFVRQIIRQLQDGQVEELGERVIDGQKAIGFIGRGQNEEVTIWADPQTALPIRIEAQIGQELSFTMKNFEFNAAVDESLVSMDVPDGYALQETDLDLGNSTEEDFVESLRIWAEIIGDSTFPEAIGTQNAMKQMPVLIQKVTAMQVSEEKGTEIGIGFAKGMLFHQILESQGQWQYNGAGVKLGDAATAIFWYQPAGSQTYRVIYGDLSVKDTAEEDLPK
jgi:outer membrane lipoprotein-sorting protein